MNATPEPTHVLVAEDSLVQAKLLERLLQRRGYRVTAASNGARALAAARLDPPGVVISDVQMPEMDGYQLCAAIKADERLRRAPVILLSSLTDPLDILRGLEAGADNYVVKPYDEDYLVTRLEQALASDALRQQHPSDVTEIVYEGQVYRIAAAQNQAIDLLLSVFSAAVRRSGELRRVQHELQALNESLEQRVRDRATALTAATVQRRSAEQAAEDSEARFQGLADSARDAIVIVDAAGAVTFWNRAAERLFGYASAVAVGQPLSALIVPAARRDESLPGFGAFGPTVPEAEAGGTLEVHACDHLGRSLLLEISLSSYPSPQARMTMGVMRDISRRKQVEAALQASEQRYRALFEATRDALVLVDSDAIVDCNGAALELYGCETRAQLVGRRLGELAPPLQADGRDSHLVASERLREAHGAGGPPFNWLLRRHDGRDLATEVVLSPVMVGDRRVVQVNVRDVSDRWRMVELAAELTAALDAVVEAVVITDAAGVVRYVNRAFTALTGYTAAEALGRSTRLLNGDGQLPDVYAEMWQTISSGAVWHGQVVNKRRDGSHYRADLTVSPIRGADGRIAEYVALQHEQTS